MAGGSRGGGRSRSHARWRAAHPLGQHAPGRMHVADVTLDVGCHDWKVKGMLPRDEEQHVVDVRRPGQRRTTIRRLGERRLPRVGEARGGRRVHGAGAPLSGASVEGGQSSGR